MGCAVDSDSVKGTSMNQKEPAVLVGLVVAAVAAIIALATAFGLNLSDAQKIAILGVFGPVYALVQAWVTRGKVYSPATVAEVTNGVTPTPPAN